MAALLPRADRLRAAAVAVVAALLAGCGGIATKQPSSSQPAPVFNLAGYSAVYKRGHADGCAQRRDEAQYREQGDYMMGWNDGRSACAKLRR